MSKSRTLSSIISNDTSKIKSIFTDSDSIINSTSLGVVVSAGVNVYSSVDLLPGSASNGDQALVTDTNRLYIYSGSGWYNIALINNTPYWITEANSSYGLATNGASTVINILAADSEGINIVYTATADSDFNQIATISKDSDNGRTFTVIPTDSDNGPQIAGTGNVTFKASDGVNLATTISTFNLSFNYFIDEFTTNTTSNSEYTWTYTGTAWSWNSSGYVYVNTGDNFYTQLEWTPSNGQTLNSSGRAFIRFLKTADWPADNNSYIGLMHSNGTDYYRATYSGSAYQSTVSKFINDTATDTVNMSYNFDDQTSYHTFEVQWNVDTIKFYVDGILQSTLVPSNNTTPIEISSIIWYNNQIQGNIDAIGYQLYDSDSSAYPFV